jgi:DNA (cytosine-5)-methyltransferase 1
MEDLLEGWPIGGFASGWLLSEFAAIHASPPCQRYSVLAKRNGNGAKWPDLIPRTRTLLRRSGLPYIMENVQGAPLLRPLVLCGASFPGLRVIRHRLFETNTIVAGRHHVRHPLVYTRDKRKAHYGLLDEQTAFVSVNGGGNCSVASARDAMGIPWMTKAELNEAIPPAYTEFIGRQLVEML